MMNKTLDSLHKKILKSKFAEEVTEAEIAALVKAKGISCGDCSRRRWYQIGYKDGKNSNNWIPCSERLPEEHDSIFAMHKGTDKWNDAMFEKISDVVNVTVADEQGKCVTTYAHTTDGKWSCDLLKLNKTYRIVAWMPLPEPCKESE